MSESYKEIKILRNAFWGKITKKITILVITF